MNMWPYKKGRTERTYSYSRAFELNEAVFLIRFYYNIILIFNETKSEIFGIVKNYYGEKIVEKVGTLRL